MESKFYFILFNTNKHVTVFQVAFYYHTQKQYFFLKKHLTHALTHSHSNTYRQRLKTQDCLKYNFLYYICST